MFDLYERIILKNPLVTLVALALIVAFFGFHSSNFKLDASADSLVLENDESLRYYRSIRARYGSDDFLFITYTPHEDLFSDQVLEDLKILRNKLIKMPRVESVTTILDVPLINSPPTTLKEINQNFRTLEHPQTDRTMAKEEFISSPIYADLLISTDANTTALQVNFKRDDTYHMLLNQRNSLREKQLLTSLSPAEKTELEEISNRFKSYNDSLLKLEQQDIAQVRALMAIHQENADLYLGGVPMIVSDSIDFIRNDLKMFGVGVACFLIVILFAAFRKARWVILPLLTCTAAGIIMVGLLGILDWRVTVVSSNFISLMLIMTLSLTVHLIVRYREFHAVDPNSSQDLLVRKTISAKSIPCLYTSITTIVAFGSLLVSGIRPVIDFGWMMVMGMSIAFILAFTLFPAGLLLLKPGEPRSGNDLTQAITRFFAQLIQGYGMTILALFILIAGLSIYGISQLSVENRFIDYYKESTEIYQGMELIDRKLGGTTPLDIVIDAPASFFNQSESEVTFRDPDDGLLAELEMDQDSVGGLTETSYWYNRYTLKRIAEIHQYLDSLPETGKVLSLSSTMRVLQQLNAGKELDDLFLSLLFNRLPETIKSSMFTPYLSADGNQILFNVRVFESSPELKREELLEKIRYQLTTEFELGEEQVHQTGMVVLYNNMLQSLFRSQILTIGAVLFAILVMFIILFRDVKIGAIAIIPNIMAVVAVLGLMGWLQIPLDIMTITIAAISIGIAVDDTIHYVHRFQEEFPQDQNYRSTVQRCHGSIGQAMYYTTITITLGFAILALSNFNPTIYFGLLTGFAMLIALLADLTLLPLLLMLFKPLGPEAPHSSARAQ